MDFLSESGHTFYLGHFISAIVTFFGGWVFFYYMKKKKRDKALHLAVSAAITYVLFHFCYLTKIWMWWAPFAALLIGVIKEFIDLLNKKKQLFDLEDLLADAVGVITVSLIYLFSFVL